MSRTSWTCSGDKRKVIGRKDEASRTQNEATERQGQVCTICSWASAGYCLVVLGSATALECSAVVEERSSGQTKAANIKLVIWRHSSCDHFGY